MVERLSDINTPFCSLHVQQACILGEASLPCIPSGMEFRGGSRGRWRERSRASTTRHVTASCRRPDSLPHGSHGSERETRKRSCGKSWSSWDRKVWLPVAAYRGLAQRERLSHKEMKRCMLRCSEGARNPMVKKHRTDRPAGPDLVM